MATGNCISGVLISPCNADSAWSESMYSSTHSSSKYIIPRVFPVPGVYASTPEKGRASTVQLITTEPGTIALMLAPNRYHFYTHCE